MKKVLFILLIAFASSCQKLEVSDLNGEWICEVAGNHFESEKFKENEIYVFENGDLLVKGYVYYNYHIVGNTIVIGNKLSGTYTKKVISIKVENGINFKFKKLE